METFRPAHWKKLELFRVSFKSLGVIDCHHSEHMGCLGEAIKSLGIIVVALRV